MPAPTVRHFRTVAYCSEFREILYSHYEPLSEVYEPTCMISQIGLERGSRKRNRIPNGMQAPGARSGEKDYSPYQQAYQFARRAAPRRSLGRDRTYASGPIQREQANQSGRMWTPPSVSGSRASRSRNFDKTRFRGDAYCMRQSQIDRISRIATEICGHSNR